MTDTVTDTLVGTPRFRLAFGSLLRADVTVLLRGWKSIAANVLLPVIILTSALRLHADLGGPATTAGLVGLVITFGLASSDIMGYPLNIARDRDGGVFRRLRVSPAPAWMVITSRLVVHLAVDIALAVLVVAISAIVHGLAFGVLRYLLLVPAAIVAGAVFLSIGQALAALLRSTTLIAAVGRILFIVLMLLGVLGATGILGTLVGSVAPWTPLGTAATLLTAALTPGPWSVPDLGAFAACLGYTAFFGWIGIRYFRWDAR